VLYFAATLVAVFCWFLLHSPETCTPPKLLYLGPMQANRASLASLIFHKMVEIKQDESFSYLVFKPYKNIYVRRPLLINSK
jgi:hypothetical protein